ncbi:MAG: hypothetical protein WCJ55_10100 [Chloroflexales bacterium]
MYTEAEREERNRRKSEAELQRVRLLGYVYPKRNPRWQRLVDMYPPHGDDAVIQAVLRVMFILGAPVAEEVLAATQRQDAAWIIAWREGLALPEPQGTPTHTKIVEMPILDLNRLTDGMVRYGVRLRRGSEENDRIINYHTNLPTKELKQLYVRLAILVASEMPDIGERVKMLYN